MEENKPKTLKNKAREAMKRMKSGFWENYRSEVKTMAEKVKAEGVDTSKVVEFYESKSTRVITKNNDEFYEKVKKILDEFGEVSDIIGRLIDKDKYDSLCYEQRQRYVLDVSNKYRESLERYKREKVLSKII